MSIKIKKYSFGSISDTLRFILHHPLNKNRKLKALSKFIWWQIFSQLPPFEYILNYGSKSKLLVRKGMTGATGNFYCGLNDYNEMFFLMHSLNKNFLEYDSEISSTALNIDFLNEIKKMEPFGTENPIPTFLIKDLKIIKSTILKDKHISSILKSKLGFTIKSICFFILIIIVETV